MLEAQILGIMKSGFSLHELLWITEIKMNRCIDAKKKKVNHDNATTHKAIMMIQLLRAIVIIKLRASTTELLR